MRHTHAECDVNGLEIREKPAFVALAESNPESVALAEEKPANVAFEVRIPADLTLLLGDLEPPSERSTRRPAQGAGSGAAWGVEGLS